MPQSLTLHTDDDVDLAADWYPVPDARRFAILLHMRPGKKEDWPAWAAALNAKGVACLAIDQRGSGRSTQGGLLDVRRFTDEDDRKRLLDAKAAFEELRDGQGATEASTILVGGSIGANVAIRFAADHPGIPLVIALSPGLDYHGVTTVDAIARLAPLQRVVVVTSDDDPESADGCRALQAAAPERTVLIEKHGLGHAERMAEKDPALIGELLSYV